MFWKADTSILPEGHCIKQKDSLSKDECHHNIYDLKKIIANKFFRDYSSNLSNFRICTANGHRKLTEEDIEPFSVS